MAGLGLVSRCVRILKENDYKLGAIIPCEPPARFCLAVHRDGKMISAANVKGTGCLE